MKEPRRVRVERVEMIESCSQCDYHIEKPDHHRAVFCGLKKVPDMHGKRVGGSDDSNYYPIPKWCPLWIRQQKSEK